MEYQYRYQGDNDNNKMWINDSERIYQLSNGKFSVIISDTSVEELFDTFEDAVNVTK
jgi:hypothetical protein